MSSISPLSPKAWVSWIKNTAQVIGTTFGAKVAHDCYNRMADNSYKRVAQKGLNRKELTINSNKLEKKCSGIENTEIADAVKVQIKEEYRGIVKEYAQTNLELGDTCKGVAQDIRSAKAFPLEADTITIYHMTSGGKLPGVPAKENSVVIEYKNKAGQILENETLSTAFVPGDTSNASSKATIQLKDVKGKKILEVKEETGKETPSSFASISNAISWHHPEVSVTVTTLDIKTGVIEERVLSKKETKVFQAVVPESNYVAVKSPRTDFNAVGVGFFLVASCYLIGVPLAKLLKEKIDSFFFSEK